MPRFNLQTLRASGKNGWFRNSKNCMSTWAAVVRFSIEILIVSTPLRTRVLGLADALIVSTHEEDIALRLKPSIAVLWKKLRRLSIAKLTWNITTLPPLSPVASSSPSWLNSTQEMRSASVTSSSKVPFTWLKHHVVSPPLPGKCIVSMRKKSIICLCMIQRFTGRKCL